MEHFFKNMPKEGSMALVIITHLSPNKESILPELIKKYTLMQVFLAEEGMKVRTNHSPKQVVLGLSGGE